MRRAILLLVLLSPLLLPTVKVAASYMMPLRGYRWTSHIISIRIETNSNWPFTQQARKTVLEAMNIWNEEQIWFVKQYLPSDSYAVYNLIESDKGIIVVRFQNWTYQFTGMTSNCKPEVFCAVSIAITFFDSTPVRDYYIRIIALHELGHVLGLGHTDVGGDLMHDTWNNATLPSTLDLYAVYVLAQGSAQPDSTTAATLPANIPYQQAPDVTVTPLPEFNWGLLLVPIFGLVQSARRKIRSKAGCRRNDMVAVCVRH